MIENIQWNHDKFMEEIVAYNHTKEWERSDQTVLKLTELVSWGIKCNLIEKCVHSAHERQILSAFLGRIKSEFPESRIIEIVDSINSHVFSYFFQNKDPLHKTLSFLTPNYKCSWESNRSRDQSGLQNLQCVSKSLYKDASIVKKNWVQANLISFKIYGHKSIEKAIKHIAELNFVNINLSNFSNLTRIHFNSLFESQPNIQTLHFDFNEMSLLESLPSVVSITKLAIERRDDNNDQISAEFSLASKSLILKTNQLSDELIENLTKSCPDLNDLSIYKVNVADKSLETFAKFCPNIKSINFWSIPVTNTELKIVAKKFVNLETISFKNTSINDENVKILTKCRPNLRTIRIDGAALTDVGVAVLAKQSRRLKSITLKATQVTTVGVAILAMHFPDLEYINLQETSIKDMGAKALAEHCPKLGYILFDGTQVTDEGVQALVRKCSNLVFISVFDTQVTEAGMQELTTSFPHVDIIYA